MDAISGMTGGMANMTDPDSVNESLARYVLSGNLELNLGPYILGMGLDLILWGVMCHQFVAWASHASGERLFIKLILAWSLVVASITTWYGIYLIWHLFVVGFGTFKGFVQPDKIGWYGLLDPLTTAAVQIFYAERAYKLHGSSIWIPLSVAPIIILTIVGGIGAKIATDRLTSLLGYGATNTWFYIWLISTFGADIFITSLIMIGLWKSRTGWSETDRLVNKLIRTSIETQLPPTLISIAFLINFSVNFRSTLNIFWELFLPKVYVVCFLAVLNWKYSIRRDLSTSDHSQKRKNSYPLRSTRPHQDTMTLDKIHVNTLTEEEVYPTTPPRIGTNRRISRHDEESAYGAPVNSSQDGLTRYPSVEVVSGFVCKGDVL